ncbi:YfhO family protein [Lacticigenium naphthae]|uniref:YfhO family protein n=1 Tax=Lacticigenium naphthae TaxID=515351 RepID=UPI0003FEFD47|nr:YfhO family protein [Lacticigenium naphthae]
MQLTSMKRVPNKKFILTGILSFLLPVFLLLILYALRGIYPFGKESLLTIDLGQQYIDLYAEYRETLLHSPSRMIYSFTKSLGGEMTGLWAYYLMSPFNLLFLLVKPPQFPEVILLITLMKTGLMSLTMAFYLTYSRQFQQSYNNNKDLIPLFSTSYALMSYSIIYQSNLMWLDGLYLLPLVILGLEKGIDLNRYHLYIGSLSLIFLTNYYIGFMISLFLILYFFYYIFLEKKTRLIKTVAQFILYSILSAGIAAFLLVPTFFSLLESKATYGSNQWSWTVLWPLQEILSKLYVGAFNFDQMPNGQPNIFTGSLTLILFFFYFFNERIPLKDKLASLFLFSIFLFSFNLEGLNKLWHAFQFPVWFPHRFSFLFSFFTILLAYKSYLAIEGVKKRYYILLGLLFVSMSYYVWQQNVEFLDFNQIIVTVAIFTSLLFLLFFRKKLNKIGLLLILIVSLSELSFNAGIVFSRLGYVDQDTFVQDQQTLANQMDNFTTENTFYRLEKTYHRSKNDSHQVNYQGVTHFSSTFESVVPELFGQLGFPAKNGFTVYSNGTLLTDAFFGIGYYFSDSYSHKKYYPPTIQRQFNDPTKLLTPVQTKPDVQFYPIENTITDMVIHQNPYALSIGFGSHEKLASLKNIHAHPLLYQEDIFRSILNTPINFFHKKTMGSFKLENIERIERGNRHYFKKMDTSIPGKAMLNFVPDFSGPYYLTFPAHIKKEDVNLFLDGQPFYQYKTYHDLLVLNLGVPDEFGSQFTIELKSEEIDVTEIELYSLNFAHFEEAIKEIQKSDIQIEKMTNLSIKGTMTPLPGQSIAVFTIPYSKNWKASVNGEDVATIKVLDSLVGVPIESTKQTIELSFIPTYHIIGMMITIISLGILLFLNYKNDPR